MDDSARHYLVLGGMSNHYARHHGGRIFVPDPDGDRGNVVRWLERVSGLP